MPFSALTRISLVDQVIAQLLTPIESGEWEVGSKIPTEAELVERFEIGRNTIREAIRALVHAGMLEPRQGDGTYVRAANDLDAVLLRRLRRSTSIEVLEVRNSLERDAARIAALRHTSHDLTTIRNAMEAQIALLNVASPVTIVDADVTFHRSIVQATHNSVLIDLYGSLAEASREAILEATAPHTRESLRIDEHVGLVDAIAKRDSEAAEEASHLHLQHSIEAILAMIEPEPSEDEAESEE